MRNLQFVLIALLIIGSITAKAQGNALGFKLGDPGGLSYKKYMGDNALEINVGRTHIFSRSNWYYNRFDKWYRGQKHGYEDWRFVNYRASFPIGLQVHYLFRKGIDKVADEKTPGLEWYFGFGGQARFQSYRYTYQYKVAGDPRWYTEEGARVVDLDIGADAVIGLEYKFKNAPLSVFGDINLFMEILDNPFLFYFQGGLGARYHF